MGHAQHDPAEYVPKEMRAYWEARDPIALYEKFLSSEKLLDAKSKKEIEDKINALLAAEREFAENSPMPPPELAETGVYCTGDDCHKIRAKWERPIADVTPPRSSVKAVWTVPGFGSGKGSCGANAPIHFGDTQHAEHTVGNKAKSANGGEPAAKVASNTAPKKTVKANSASASRKARR
jgi:hypothetical protein